MKSVLNIIIYVCVVDLVVFFIVNWRGVIFGDFVILFVFIIVLVEVKSNLKVKFVM